MNCISARSSRASAPLSTTKRAPESFAAVVEIHQAERLADLEMLLRLEAVGKAAAARRGGAPRRCRSRPCRRARRRAAGWGWRRVRSSSARAGAPSPPPRVSGIAAFSRATSSLKRLGGGGVLARHRRADLLRGGVAALLRLLQFEDRGAPRIVERDQQFGARRQPAARQRLRQTLPDCRESLLISCMNSPDGATPAAQQPVAEDVEARGPPLPERRPQSSNAPRGSPKIDRAGDHADDRHQQRERRDRRRRIARQQPRPEAEAEHRAGIGDDEHADDERQARMGERERALPARRPAATATSSGAGATRLDQTMKASMSTRPASLGRRRCPRPRRRPRSDDHRERPEARAGEPRRADQRDAGEGDERRQDLRPARPFAEQAPRRAAMVKNACNWIDQRGEPDRKSLRGSRRTAARTGRRRCKRP